MSQGESAAATIVALLEIAPGWCRVRLTAPTAALRVQAREALAAFIAAGLEQPPGLAPDSRQLALPIVT